MSAVREPATQTHVLIVEDDKDTCEIIQKALERRRITCDCASTVGEALVMLEGERRPDALILDLNLPDANGTLLLRKIHREQLPVKVAVVTGVANPERFIDPLGAPPDQLFPKPVNLAMIVRWVQSQ